VGLIGGGWLIGERYKGRPPPNWKNRGTGVWWRQL